MKRLLKWLFTGDGHLHKWKIIKEGELSKTNGNSVIGVFYVMQCEKCGELKKFEEWI